MSVAQITRARGEAEAARRRLLATVGELQERLKPGNLAGRAWEGVKDKGGELADGAVTGLKARPLAVSAAVGAVALYLARGPISTAVARLIDDDEPTPGPKPPRRPRRKEKT